MEEPPIHLIAYARQLNRRLLKGKKANLRVCGLVNYGWSKETKCEECNEICYYTDDSPDMYTKNSKKVCIKCVLQNHKKELNKDQIKILEEAIDGYKRV